MTDRLEDYVRSINVHLATGQKYPKLEGSDSDEDQTYHSSPLQLPLSEPFISLAAPFISGILTVLLILVVRQIVLHKDAPSRQFPEAREGFDDMSGLLLNWSHGD